MQLTPEEKAGFLRWPDISVCGESWCPTLTDGYCCECHGLAHAAMIEARVRFVSWVTGTPLDDVWALVRSWPSLGRG